jgi:[ribosomal protein S5]-alanine N-acetyltransferase
MHADTRRLHIETLRRGHAALLFAVLIDPRIYTFIPDSPPTSRRELAQRYAQLERGAPAESTERWLNWVVRLKATRVPIGTLQATVHGERAASIAYVLSPRHWDRGYATEACTWLLDYLSTELGIAEFRASADARNVASWRLLEALAFTRIGEEAVEMHGEPATDYLYHLTRVAR